MKKQNNDLSPRVTQRDKLKNTLTFREFKWTPKQQELINLCLDKNTRIVFINGPAGSTKTICAVYSALQLLNEKKVSDIVYIRSAVESSESRIGFLPGEVADKLYFYNLPFYDKLEELLIKPDIDRLQKEKRVSIYPVNYARGLNWNAKCVIFDECQNSTYKEMITVLTRLGRFSKCFVLADPVQTDLLNGKRGAFDRMVSVFCGPDSQEQGIHCFHLTEEDIMRDELTKFLVRKFKDFPP